MKYSLLFIFLIVCTSQPKAQTMKIDEDFGDWTSAQLAHEDVVGDGRQNSIDFKRLWMADDEDNLYIHVELGREIEIQEFEDLYLYVDIDNNINTGVSAQNIGADFVYRFGQRDGYLFLNNNFYDVGHNDFDLVTLPTVSSDKFEISFSKKINYFNGTIELGDQINLAFVDVQSAGDRIPDQASISYVMHNDAFSPPPYQLSKSVSSDVRLMSYNALQDGLFEVDRQPAFLRLLSALNPEIVCFQEIYNHSSFEVAQLMESALPSGPTGEWHHSQVNPDIIIASRYPITATFVSDGNGIFELQIEDEKVIIVNAHLPCCNNDKDRQLEIDRLMSFIRNSINGFTNLSIEENTPMFIVGDMNLVGDRQQQHSLSSGDIVNEFLYGSDFFPDWDDTALDDALPFITGAPHAVTWYNPFGSFSAGRLDYLLYTASVAELKNSFALNTKNLMPSELAMFNLEATDTEVASDHFPCIMDVDLDPESGIFSHRIPFESINLFPNPVADFINISSDEIKSFDKIVIADLKGKIIIEETLQENISSEFSLNVKNLLTGIYFLKLSSGEGIWVGKVVKE